MSGQIHIFQIFYNEQTRAALDPGFEPLDNSGNERPDWFEYWPIRAYLQAQALVDDDYYGFFSPKFGDKTGLSAATVRSVVEGAAGADVVTFSPYPDLACLYASVYEQGENFHRGLLEISQAFFAAIGFEVDIRGLVTDARTSIFSNFFVAKGSFWRRWREILEQCVAMAEEPASPLHGRLTGLTPYHKQAQMKIFVMERIPSVLLATTPGLRIHNHEPFNVPLSDPRFIPLGNNLIALDALKSAYLRGREWPYMTCFRALQRATFEAFHGASGCAIPR